MRQFQNVLGLLAGAILVLSSAAHSLLGWKQMQRSLAAVNAPADLVQGLEIGWLFGGVAILTFGCVAPGKAGSEPHFLSSRRIEG